MILSRLKTQLQKRYGDEWVELEPETVSLDLGIALDPVSLQGIMTLQTIEKYPERYTDDASYFISFTEVANNKVVHPEYTHMPNSLELAWALHELSRLGIEYKKSNAIRKVCMYLLREEGYSEPVAPFDAFLKSGDFYNGQSAKQTADKAKAIRLYIRAMEKSGGKA